MPPDTYTPTIQAIRSEDSSFCEHRQHLWSSEEKLTYHTISSIKLSPATSARVEVETVQYYWVPGERMENVMGYIKYQRINVQKQISVTRNKYHKKLYR